MSPIGAPIALICLTLALGCSFLLVTWFGKPAAQGRFVTIDGLRGYLAFAVFIHHIPVWYSYCRSGIWHVPSSSVYTNLGQVGVAFFFMITAFLFYSKLIDGKKKPVNWTRLYISRVFRLWPLYLFAVLLLFLMVAYLSGGELRVPLRPLTSSLVRWLAFSIFGGPDINGVHDTFAIIAGVTWSLAYEWFFYGSLPILALTVGTRAPALYIGLSAAALMGAAALHPLPIFFLAFAGGIAAAVLVRNETVCKLAQGPAVSLLAIICVASVLIGFSSAYAPVPLLLLSVAFVAFACGNTLFGVLTSGTSRMLGDMSYSIYLLQGFILYCAYGLGVGAYEPAALSPTQHCLIAIACTPLLIFSSFATYRLIELPAMKRVQSISAWITRRPLVR